jgi:hypothetical protein
MPISFKTASLLKEAHFPQPKIEFGQTWYDPKGGLWIAGAHSAHNPLDLVFRALGNTAWGWPNDADDFTFAPSAIEVLPELQKMAFGTHWALSCEPDSKRYQLFLEDARTGDNLHGFVGENADELTAEAYLFLKTNQNS